MQALKSLFRRAQASANVPAQRPVALSPESLKLVGGGLPRVSTPITTDAVSYKLPRVS
jgi:hypothetical protein